MMNLNNLLGQALEQLKNNQNVKSNPMAQGMIDVVESGDAKRGEQMANNLCESMGITKEDALKQAKAFFNIP